MAKPAPRRHLPLLPTPSASEPPASELRRPLDLLRCSLLATGTTVLAWAPLAALSQIATSRWLELRFGGSVEALAIWLPAATLSQRLGYHALTLFFPLAAFLLASLLGGVAVARVKAQSAWVDAGLGGLGAATLAWLLTLFRMGMSASLLVLLVGGSLGFASSSFGWWLVRLRSR